MLSPIHIVGVDPGFTGAIAHLDPGSWDLKVYDIPTTGNLKGRIVMNHRQVAELLRPPEVERCIGILERVGCMPGQGISSAFRFGSCAGALEMAMVGHSYEFFDPSPATWKRHFKLSSDKDASRGLASQRFPAQSHLFSRKKDDGRAEAALLALWGVEVVLPKLGLTVSSAT